MDARFNDALAKTLKHEGGYNNTQGDAGGATNFGISLRYLKDLYKSNDWVDLDRNGVVNQADIKALTQEDVAKIYYEQFWEKQRCSMINATPLAAKLFDMSVNMGLTQAAKLLQRAVNTIGHSSLAVDGRIGFVTITAVNACEADYLLILLRIEAMDFYRNLVKMKPEYNKFLKGWLRRVFN